VCYEDAWPCQNHSRGGQGHESAGPSMPGCGLLVRHPQLVYVLPSGPGFGNFGQRSCPSQTGIFPCWHGYPRGAPACQVIRQPRSNAYLLHGRYCIVVSASEGDDAPHGGMIQSVVFGVYLVRMRDLFPNRARHRTDTGCGRQWSAIPWHPRCTSTPPCYPATGFYEGLASWLLAS
jgi:hypothetical protein